MRFNKLIDVTLRDHSWKGMSIIALIAFGLLIVLDSFLFAFVIMILKCILVIIVIAAASRSIWLAYPILKRKYEEESTKKTEV